MQEQEVEANTVIAQWQESFNESENKCSNMCSQLEEELAAVKKEKDSLEKSLETIEQVDEHLEEAKSSLDAKIATLEDAIEDELEDVKVTEEEALQGDENQSLEQLREELKAAQDTLERDEDVVHQWQGTLTPKHWLLKPM
jgi:predicted  nucleic acid-binding Zn-ribbon protein